MVFGCRPRRRKSLVCVFGSIDCTAIYLWTDLIHTTGALYKIGKLVKHIRIIIITDRDDSDMYWVILRRRLRSLHVGARTPWEPFEAIEDVPLTDKNQQNTKYISTYCSHNIIKVITSTGAMSRFKRDRLFRTKSCWIGCKWNYVNSTGKSVEMKRDQCFYQAN